jgi:nucleoside-diphosphate-sugar epimerase
MKILLTGAQWKRPGEIGSSWIEKGMIGSHLKPYLESQGHEVVVFEDDIRDPASWYKHRNTSINMVVHLAAKPGVLDSVKHPEYYWDVNVNGTTRAFEFCQSECCPILYASSSNAHEWWLNPYAATKKATEAVAEGFAIDSIGMRFHTVWPGRDDMLFKKIERGEVEYINLDHSRDFIHVDDLCSAISTIIDNYHTLKKDHKVVDIGTGISYNIGDVFKKYSTADVYFRYGESQCERTHTEADIEYLKDLGWTHTKDII